MSRSAKTEHDIGVCPVCFAVQVVRDGIGRNLPSLVDHGYSVPWGTGGRRGSCDGVNRPHFGTPEGREIARAVSVAYRRAEADERKHAAKIIAGTADVFRQVHKGWDSVTRKSIYVSEKIENPTQYDREHYAREFTYRADMMASTAKSIEDRVAAWVETKPVTVPRESLVPNVHAPRYGSTPGKVVGRLCAMSYRGHTGIIAADGEPVTCERCLKRLAEAKVRRENREKMERTEIVASVCGRKEKPDRLHEIGKNVGRCWLCDPKTKCRRIVVVKQVLDTPSNPV